MESIVLCLVVHPAVQPHHHQCSARLVGVDVHHPAGQVVGKVAAGQGERPAALCAATHGKHGHRGHNQMCIVFHFAHNSVDSQDPTKLLIFCKSDKKIAIVDENV